MGKLRSQYFGSLIAFCWHCQRSRIQCCHLLIQDHDLEVPCGPCPHPAFPAPYPCRRRRRRAANRARPPERFPHVLCTYVKRRRRQERRRWQQRRQERRLARRARRRRHAKFRPVFLSHSLLDIGASGGYSGEQYKGERVRERLCPMSHL